MPRVAAASKLVPPKPPSTSGKVLAPTTCAAAAVALADQQSSKVGALHLLGDGKASQMRSHLKRLFGRLLVLTHDHLHSYLDPPTAGAFWKLLQLKTARKHLLEGAGI